MRNADELVSTKPNTEHQLPGEERHIKRKCSMSFLLRGHGQSHQTWNHFKSPQASFWDDMASQTKLGTISNVGETSEMGQSAHGLSQAYKCHLQLNGTHRSKQNTNVNRLMHRNNSCSGSLTVNKILSTLRLGEIDEVTMDVHMKKYNCWWDGKGWNC